MDTQELIQRLSGDLQDRRRNKPIAAFRRHLATEAVKPGAGSAVLAGALAFVLDRDTELAHIAA